jgi:predicted permease
MSWLKTLLARIAASFGKGRLDRELDDEVRTHLELLAEEYVRRGMSEEDARFAARRAFGGVEQAKEAYRDQRGMPALETFLQDLRFGARVLAKRPVFTAVVVLSLALGIGANTAVFSLIDAVLLKSLPVREPDEIVLFGNAESMGLTNSFPNRSWDLFSYPFYRDVRQRNQTLSDVAAFRSFTPASHGSVDAGTSGGDVEKIDAQLVSGTYFSVLGVKASLGRLFTEADDRTPGAHPVAVASHAWWQQRLGGDPSAVGKAVTIGDVSFTIVGVAPREFFGVTVGEVPDVWVPLAMEEYLPPGWKTREEPLEQSLYLVGRLRDGVAVERASADVNLLFKQALLEYAGSQPSDERLQDIQRASIELTPGARGISGLRREFSLPLRILMVVVGIVLLIACSNVANLLLARAASRQREFAVRHALGAGRTRITRQLLTESLLLAGLGGAVGIVLAIWGSRLLVAMVSSGPDPLPLDVTPDLRVLGFTLLVSVLSAIVFGTAPAFRAARVELNSSLKGGKGAVTSASRGPLGKALVVLQVALSLVLLVGAGLFLRTLMNLRNVDTGFDGDRVVVFQTDTSATGYKEDEKLAGLFREVGERVKAVPGVRAASFSMFTFNQGAWSTKAFTRGQNPLEGRPGLLNNIVDEDFFAVMGLPLVTGRGFGPHDTASSPKVAVISETMARIYFPGESALGRRFGRGKPENSEDIEVIGVVKDAKYMAVDEETRPMAYYPYSQGISHSNNFLVSFAGDVDSVVPAIRRAIREANDRLPVDDVATLSEQVDRSLVQEKLVARLSSFFGLIALLLACVGLYGILSYAVARRTNEIGIRMALGATRADVIWLVLREAMTLVLAGVVAGLLAAAAGARAVTSLLYGLDPTDPTTIGVATLLLVAVAALAGCLPARRATRVDPLVALRDD